MPQVCKVCTHDRRGKIDAALIGGKKSLRELATLYAVSAKSLERHKANHLPATMVKAEEAATVANAGTLLDQVKDLQTHTLKALCEAEQASNLGMALGAIREARGNLEFLARLTKELPASPTVINVLLSDEWISLRSAILAALDPYPDAIEAVSHAISR